MGTLQWGYSYQWGQVVNWLCIDPVMIMTCAIALHVGSLSRMVYALWGGCCSHFFPLVGSIRGSIHLFGAGSGAMLA